MNNRFETDSDKNLPIPRASGDSGFYRALVRACPDAVIVTDLEGTITEASEKVLSLYGGDSVEELIGRKCFEFIAPEDRDRAAANLRLTLERGCFDTVEYRLLRKDGTPFTGELSASVVRDPEGRPFALIAATRDITARRRTEQALRDSEELYRTLFNGAGDAIFTVELDTEGTPGNIIEANEVACRQLGFNKQELRHMVPEDLDDMEDLPHKFQYMRDLLKSGNGFFETRVRAKDGTLVPVEVNSHLVRLGSKNVILNVARDISDRKRAEAEIRKADKLESLGTLAGGIAHDFNNFLTGIVGNLSLIVANRDKRRDDSEHIRRAMDVAMRARALTQQLLTFSVGGAPVTKTCSVADTLVDTVEIAMSGANVKCDLDIHPGTWPVEMDEGQIAQVISNLIINARESMHNGGSILAEVRNVVLEEGQFPCVPSGKYVCIGIADKGEGIPKEHLSKIFDPYFTTKSSGNGLGLASAASIIKNHRGVIEVESEVGIGSLFRVYLPASTGERLSPKKPTSLPDLSQKKVLIMDDNTMILEVLSEMLSRLGGDILIATNGTQALERVRAESGAGKPVDLAILDLTIPGGMGGQAVFRELRKIAPSIQGIVSSGYFHANVMSDFKEHGFSAVLRKPYLFEDLCEVLSTVNDMT